MIQNKDTYIPIANRGLIVAAVMSASLMQVLDTTIVNVALPHMQGSLNAAPDQISWTLTSYLVASAIIMPLAGYFSDRFGQKQYLLWCIAGFTLASALCGMAGSLTQIVGFRILQGVFGAALVPLSQAILIGVYPPKELGKAMAIWGSGIMVGPVLGPTLGGYLTEIANWRWTFYINIPVGIMAFVLAWKVVPEMAKKKREFDWIGFLLITIAIGSTQYLFDRGSHDDWFNATSIQLAAFLAVSGFIGFIIYSCFNRGPQVINLAIFKDRNFTVASILLMMMGVGLFGSMVILPMFLQGLLNYPVSTTGLMMTPRAISVMISMMVMGKIGHRFDPRYLIAIGAITSAIGTYVCTCYSAELSKWWLIWPMFLQGIGLGMIFVPIGTVGFATISEKVRVEAAGLSSLLRTLGASIGIAVTLTVYTRHVQFGWNQLVGFVNPYNPNLEYYMQEVVQKLPVAATTSDYVTAAPFLGGVVAKQAMMLSIVNVFAFVAASLLIMVPLVLLLKRAKKLDKAVLPPVID